MRNHTSMAFSALEWRTGGMGCHRGVRVPEWGAFPEEIDHA